MNRSCGKIGRLKNSNRRSLVMVINGEIGKRLSLSAKLSRLGRRLREPQWRRYGGLLLGGKALGLLIVFLVITIVSGLFFVHVHAQAGAPEIKASDTVNPINTAWVLLAAFLV